MKTKAIILAVIFGIVFLGISQTTLSQDENLTRQLENTEKIKELSQEVDGLSKEMQELKKNFATKEDLKKEVERQIGWQISWSKWIIMFAVAFITFVVVVFSLIIAWWSTIKIKHVEGEFDKEMDRAVKQNEKFEKDYKELIEKATEDIKTLSKTSREVAREEFDKYQKEISERAGKERKITEESGKVIRYLGDKKYQEAIDSLNRIIDLKPSNEALAVTYYNLACAYALRKKEGDRGRMLEYLKRAVELDGKYKKMAKEDDDFKDYLDDHDFKKLVE